MASERGNAARRRAGGRRGSGRGLAGRGEGRRRLGRQRGNQPAPRTFPEGYRKPLYEWDGDWWKRARAAEPT